MRGLAYGLLATLPGTLLVAGAVLALVGRRRLGLRVAAASVVSVSLALAT